MIDLRRPRAHYPVKAYNLLRLRRAGIMASLSYSIEPAVSAALAMALAPPTSCVCPPILARIAHWMTVRQRGNAVLEVDAPLDSGDRADQS